MDFNFFLPLIIILLILLNPSSPSKPGQEVKNIRKICHSCISMAISDLSALDHHYKLEGFQKAIQFLLYMQIGYYRLLQKFYHTLCSIFLVVFIQIVHNEASDQAKGITTLIKAFKWKETVLIYEDNDNERDFFPHMFDSSPDANIHSAHRISTPPSSSDEHIWVVGFKPYIPPSNELHNFTLRWRRKMYIDHPNAEVLELDSYAILAYDTVWALVEAVHKLNNSEISHSGLMFYEEIMKGRFEGYFQLSKGKLISRGFELVNTCKSGNITKELNKNSPSTSDLEGIIWPGGF
ncbi:hypothetical protein ACOSQ3_003062 [Xanthoceras sorbifolium]